MERGFLVPDLPEVDEDISRHPAYLTLDWDAYFETFKTEHGDPVRWKGLLLFQDGWRYSAKHKSGPEYPPPNDTEQLHYLKTYYWLTRLNIVTAERNMLRDTVVGLRALQRNHHLPLQQQTSVYDELSGRHAYKAQILDIDELEHGRLAWLEQDVLDCQRQLQQLQNEK